jgi:hypothetical protein
MSSCSTKRRLLTRHGHAQSAQTHVSKQHFGLFKSEHVPHEISCPQLFTCVPHTCPALLHARPLSVQPHWSGTPPPPHVSGDVHVPQLSVPPQPSEKSPQFAPSAWHVVGVQPH